MSLKLSERSGERTVLLLASALGFEPEIDVDELASARSCAFEARSAKDFAWHWLRSECFSKWGENPSVDLAAVAYSTFRATEREVRAVNCWLRHPQFNGGLGTKWLPKAREIVHKILGRFCLEELVRSCDWSPGATTEMKRSVSQVENKWVKATHLTDGLEPYYRAFTKYAQWSQVWREPTFVPGNRVTTVPKSYKTDRVIAVEPSWNMFFQKGIGRMIRRRLRAFGQLHPSAQKHARFLAQAGSSHGLLATLDLRNASDSVSMALCEALLPEDWFSHLIQTRSQIGTCEGVTVPYAKISSMGNGYTFELETLVFYALASAHAGIGSKWTHVYGDDIIVQTDLAEALIETLAEAGFETNPDKSFITGPFRESCGGHYWNGCEVTPFYLKQYPRHVGDVIVLHNKVHTWRNHQGWNELDEFEPLLSYLRRLTPRRFWGPMGEDGSLWSAWDAARPEWVKRYQSFRCWRLNAVQQIREETCDDWELGSYMQTLWKDAAQKEMDHAYAPSGKSPRYVAHKYQIDRAGWKDPTA